ncbi:hypothetical protein SALBM311S_10266 [Streptomyces alboniger]
MTAKVIADDIEALTVARLLADEFRAGASERDAERRLPRARSWTVSDSGLLAVTVPAEHGGADVARRPWPRSSGCSRRPTRALARSHRATACT